jgi:hypothetical protein
METLQLKASDTIIIKECVELLDSYIYDDRRIDHKTISHIELCLKDLFRESIEYFQVKSYMMTCSKRRIC